MELKNGLVADFYGVCHYFFKLGNQVFEVVEDENDGYRSAMKELRYVSKEEAKSLNLIFFQTPIAKIQVKEVEGIKVRSGWADFQGYILEDVIDQHHWLIAGTDNYQDYYPGFVFDYYAKEQAVLDVLQNA